MSKITLVSLGVSDLAKSVAFYREKAGFELQGQMEQFAFFSAGAITLMLNAPLGRRGGPLAGAMELVVAAESVTRRYQELNDLGCTFITEPRQVNGDSWAATFTDPDGHMLTVFGPK
ncbi:MAG TPA: VOC family protein [Terriglobia bacterium]|nr:VOC family protein [Terriglobia bacterium]